MEAKRARWLFNSAIYGPGEAETLTVFGAVMLCHGAETVHRADDEDKIKAAAKALREWADSLEGK